MQPRKDAYSHKHPGPADVILIIEVADSSLEYDTAVKTALYAIMGIVEYWVADLRNDRVLCYSDPFGDSFRTVREFHRGDIVAPLLLQDCPLGLGALLPQ